MILKLVIVLLPVLAILVIFVMAGRSARKKGSGNMTTLSLGATYHLLSEDKKRAAEIVVKQNAGAKLKEQSSEGDKVPPTDGGLPADG